jgi:glycosyltransferase involved in cell wall biosynthesis
MIFMREKWAHMSNVSGFDLLVHALQLVHPELRTLSIFKDTSRSSLSRLFDRVVGRRKSAVSGGFGPFWGDANSVQEKRAIDQFYRNPDCLLFLCAGEDQLGHKIAALPDAERRSVFVVVHQPASWYRLHWTSMASFRGLGGVFCLSESQRRFFAETVDVPVHVVRHGVDLTFFKPAEDRQEGPQPRIIFVGQWLRDLVLLESVMTKIWSTHPNVSLDCVIPSRARTNSVELLRLARSSQVRWYAGIAAEELRSLYQAADLLLMPLIDASANNAILEALACGLPIVATDVGGVREYVPEGAGYACAQGDAEAHASAVLRIISDRELRMNMSQAARAFAEHHCGWDIVARNIANILGAHVR